MPRCFLAKQCNGKGYRPPENRKWNSNEGDYVTCTISSNQSQHNSLCHLTKWPAGNIEQSQIFNLLSLKVSPRPPQTPFSLLLTETKFLMFKCPGPGPGSSCQYIAIYTIYNAIYTRVVPIYQRIFTFCHLLNLLRLPFPSSPISTIFPSLNPTQIQNSIQAPIPLHLLASLLSQDQGT